MTMVLHFSSALAKKLRVHLSFKNRPISQMGREDSWSADIIKVNGKESMVLVMHDASQWPILIPIEGCRTYEKFITLLMIMLGGNCRACNKPFDHENQQILLTRRTNRTLIGYMNDAKRCASFTAEAQLEANGTINWSQIIHSLANTPYRSKDGFFTPHDKFLG